jgi:hypothetical protein
MQTICILVLVSERNTWQIGKHESRLGRVKATGGGEGHNYSPERLKLRNNASKQHRRRMATPLLKGLNMERKPVRIEIEYEDGTINRCTKPDTVKNLEHTLRTYLSAQWPFEFDNPKLADNNREAFAMAAMQGLLAKDTPVPIFANDYTQLAAKAVLCADALISALSTPPPSMEFNAQTPQVVYVKVILNDVYLINSHVIRNILVSLTPREGYMKVEVEK